MSKNEMLTAMRVCCDDTLIASPRRHEVGFETTCVCGNIIRATVWQNGWEVFAPAVSRDISGVGGLSDQETPELGQGDV